MGTYKTELDRSRSSMSAEQIHANKIAKKKARSEMRKKVCIAMMTMQNIRHSAPSYPTEQLKKLDFRLGEGVGAVRERRKLEERILKENK